MTDSLQTKPNNKIKKLVIAIVIFIVIIFLIITIFTPRIASIAKAQIKAINQGNISQAYAMTSGAFQRETPYENFVEFVDQYPMLKHSKNVKFSKHKIEGGLGYLSGVIEGEDGSKMTIEYQLVKENDEWKIQGIRLTPMQNSATVPATIDSILVSDGADQEGYVKTTTLPIPRGAKKIFVTVRIVAPEKGAEISATLIHGLSGNKIGPVKGVISKTGNVMKAFSFTRGESAWPKGDYEIQVETSAGESKIFRFDVK